MGDRRRRGVAISRINQRHNIIGGEHLQRGGPGRLGQAVGVAADEQRSGGALSGAVLGDRLRGGQDVRLVERAVEARSAVPGGAERDLLGDVVGVGLHRVVRGDEVGQVDQVFGLRRLPGAGISRHDADCAPRGRYLLRLSLAVKEVVGVRP